MRRHASRRLARRLTASGLTALEGLLCAAVVLACARTGGAWVAVGALVIAVTALAVEHVRSTSTR